VSKLVKVDQWEARIGRQGVEIEDVLHRGYEGRVLFRREAPALLRPGFEVVFFSVTRTVSPLIDSTKPSSMTVPAIRFSV
jgi:hypothetical protein